MTKEIMLAYVKFLDNNYAIGPVDYDSIKDLDDAELEKTLRNMAFSAFKKKVCREYSKFLKEIAKKNSDELFGFMQEVDYKSDATRTFLKHNYNPCFNLDVENLLLLIQYSNILSDLYEKDCKVNSNELEIIAKSCEYENSRFTSDITIRSSSSMNEPITFSIESSYKDLDTSTDSAVIEKLTDENESYHCNLAIYYKHAITDECIFYGSANYLIEKNSDDWNFKKI